MGLVGDNMPLLYICRRCEEDCDQLVVFIVPGVTKNEVTLHQLQAVENPHATVTTAGEKNKNKTKPYDWKIKTSTVDRWTSPWSKVADVFNSINSSCTQKQFKKEEKNRKLLAKAWISSTTQMETQ